MGLFEREAPTRACMGAVENRRTAAESRCGCLDRSSFPIDPADDRPGSERDQIWTSRSASPSLFRAANRGQSRTLVHL